MSDLDFLSFRVALESRPVVAALGQRVFIKLGFLDAWKASVPGREVEMFLRLKERLDAVASEVGELSLTIPMACLEAVAA